MEAASPACINPAWTKRYLASNARAHRSIERARPLRAGGDGSTHAYASRNNNNNFKIENDHEGNRAKVFMKRNFLPQFLIALERPVKIII